jgi:hypothetical protein
MFGCGGAGVPWQEMYAMKHNNHYITYLLHRIECRSLEALLSAGKEKTE